MKYKILVLLILFVFCVSYGSSAEPMQQKSSMVALSYSLGATILPSIPTLIFLCSSEEGEVYVPVTSLALSFAGIIAGPSMGHFYAGNREKGMSSIGFRSICFGAGALTLLIGGGYLMSNMDSDLTLIFLIAQATGIAIAGSALFDIFTCPSSVRKYNQSIRGYGGFYLTPEIDLKTKNYGLSIAYRF